jgi:hypothetical protein
MDHAGDAAPVGTMTPERKNAVVQVISENHRLGFGVSLFWHRPMSNVASRPVSASAERVPEDGRAR